MSSTDQALLQNLQQSFAIDEEIKRTPDVQKKQALLQAQKRLTLQRHLLQHKMCNNSSTPFFDLRRRDAYPENLQVCVNRSNLTSRL